MAMSIEEQHQRASFGGLHFGTAFFGWLVATGMATLLTALLSAIGGGVALTGIKDSLAQNSTNVGIVSAVLLLIALAAAYYSGGYVAGRMSRFDGAKQGLGVWVIGIVMTIVLAIAGAILGSNFNLLQQIHLPFIPVSAHDLTIGAIISLLITAAVTLLAAMSGGFAGERYHHKIDAVGKRGAQISASESAAKQDKNSTEYTTDDQQENTHTKRYDQVNAPTFGETVDNREMSRSQRAEQAGVRTVGDARDIRDNHGRRRSDDIR